MDHYDVAIVGAGVSGAAVARWLSEYELDVVLLEKEADVSFGVSKGNSGIIHGGFHHNRRHLKARLEVEGAAMYPRLHRELGFPYKPCGIVVAALSNEELNTVSHLYRQGVENGSAGIEVCGQSRLRELEPKIHPDAIGGLYAPAGGIIEPYRFVFALVENAVANGVTLVKEFEVAAGARSDDGFRITSADGRVIRARYVVNAAGLSTDRVAEAFGAEVHEIHPRRGQYHLLDRTTSACPQRVIFPVPTPVSKGILVIPTVEGTVLLGPTADPVDDREDVRTTAEKMHEIIVSARRIVPSISSGDIITSFSGLRPALDTGDFHIAESERVPGFIHVAGIQSPGLTAAPAVGELVKNLLKVAGCRLTEKSRFVSTAAPVERTRLMDPESIQEHWGTDADAGEVVCRCETVTRDEIVTAIRAGHTTVDGIKFFCRATAGRCQGSFCTPRILQIIGEETGTPVTGVSKRGPGSELIVEPMPGTPETIPPVPEARTKQSERTALSRQIGVEHHDAVVIGGGAAGMAAAVELARRGFVPVVIDREALPGGVLRQCVHNGFGIHEFGEELTGPEYAERYVAELERADVPVYDRTTVLAVERDEHGFRVRTLSRTAGVRSIECRAVVLAMGSRERNRGGIQIPGTRPAGVLTAGAAQRLINVDGFIPGRRAVVIGSGDIGLIMARRLKLIGADVEAVIEIQPVPSGINRNIVQCLTDFGIPLYLGHVVTEIHGSRRVSGIDVAPLEGGVPRVGRSFHIACDTVLLSVGLVPENELSRVLGVQLHGQTHGPRVDSRLMTSVPGVFAAGNVLHIHDLVDFVAEESRRAGQAAADYLDGVPAPPELELSAGSNVRYVMPGRVRTDAANRIYLRSLISRNNAVVEVRAGDTVLKKHRELHVQPSEMISLELGPKLWAKLSAEDLPQKIEVALR